MRHHAFGYCGTEFDPSDVAPVVAPPVEFPVGSPAVPGPVRADRGLHYKVTSAGGAGAQDLRHAWPQALAKTSIRLNDYWSGFNSRDLRQEPFSLCRLQLRKHPFSTVHFRGNEITDEFGSELTDKHLCAKCPKDETNQTADRGSHGDREKDLQTEAQRHDW